jgi:hypothetical protein
MYTHAIIYANVPIAVPSLFDQLPGTSTFIDFISLFYSSVLPGAYIRAQHVGLLHIMDSAVVGPTWCKEETVNAHW